MTEETQNEDHRLPWRVGRSNPYTVYIDRGEPYDAADAHANCIGFFRKAEDATRAANAHNSVLRYIERHEAMLDEPVQHPSAENMRRNPVYRRADITWKPEPPRFVVHFPWFNVSYSMADEGWTEQGMRNAVDRVMAITLGVEDATVKNFAWQPDALRAIRAYEWRDVHLFRLAQAEARETVFRMETLQDSRGEEDVARFGAWQRGEEQPPLPAELQRYFARVKMLTRKGVVCSRVRIIFEPLTDLVKWQLTNTYQYNMEAGEEVRVIVMGQYETPPAGLIGVKDFWLVDATRLFEIETNAHGEFMGMTHVPAPEPGRHQGVDFLSRPNHLFDRRKHQAVDALRAAVPLADYLRASGLS